MKKLTYILILILVSPFVNGQNSYEKPFHIKRKPGIMRFYTLKAPTETSAEKFDRVYTDFFYNSWLGDMNGVTTKPYAIGHSINIMYDLPFSKTSRMGVAIGLGYSHYSIRHDGFFTYQPDPNNSNALFSEFAPYTGDKRWINRSVFNFIDVPFEIRFRSRKERPKFKFYPGFKASYLVGDYQKWRIGKNQFKDFNYPDLNRIHYGPTIRIGVSNIMLYAYYDMTYMFTNENSNQLQLFGAGITVSWF